jgi:hypothetical protein
MNDRREVDLENKKIRHLRNVVDLSLLEIRSGGLSVAEAYELEQRVFQFAMRLFPGKEDTFNLIYAPRFRRAINERFFLQ